MARMRKMVQRLFGTAKQRVAWGGGGLLVVCVGVLAAVPAAAFGPFAVLNRLAVAAKDPLTIGLVITGLVIVTLTTVLIIDRQSAAKGIKPSGPAERLLIGFGLMIFMVVLVAMILFTARTGTSSAAAAETFQRLQDELVATVELTDRSEEQNPQPGTERRAIDAADAMRDHLLAHSRDVGEDACARGWSLLAMQYTILGKHLQGYERAKDAITRLHALPHRYWQFVLAIEHYVGTIIAARNGLPPPSPPADYPDQRLAKVSEIERLLYAGDRETAFQKATIYVELFKSDAGSDSPVHLLQLGNAYKLAAISRDLEDLSQRDYAETLARAGLELAESALARLHIPTLTLHDLRFLLADCHDTLARIAQARGDRKAAALHYQAALEGVRTVATTDHVTGRCRSMLQWCDALIELSRSLGDHELQAVTKDTRTRLITACQ